MSFREVTVDGEVHGYVEDDPQGREIADKYVLNHAKRDGVTRPIDKLPQGARRLDR